MTYMKKTTKLIISAAALTLFTGCSSPAKDEQSASEQPIKETAQALPAETPAETPVPTATPVPVPSETTDPEAHGPYSPSEAFAGFDSYTAGSKQVTLGTTTYGEVSQYLTIQKAGQYGDETHESVMDPEVLQSGALGQVITDYYAKNGGQLTYMLYNPADTDAEFEDCVITGVANEEGMTFSNGIDYWSVTPNDLAAILGAPYEIKGTANEKLVDAQLLWRDESNEHQLTLIYYDDGQVRDVNGLSYLNLSAKH